MKNKLKICISIFIFMIVGCGEQQYSFYSVCKNTNIIGMSPQEAVKEIDSCINGLDEKTKKDIVKYLFVNKRGSLFDDPNSRLADLWLFKKDDLLLEKKILKDSNENQYIHLLSLFSQLNDLDSFKKFMNFREINFINDESSYLVMNEFKYKIISNALMYSSVSILDYVVKSKGLDVNNKKVPNYIDYFMMAIYSRYGDDLIDWLFNNGYIVTKKDCIIFHYSLKNKETFINDGTDDRINLNIKEAALKKYSVFSTCQKDNKRED